MEMPGQAQRRRSQDLTVKGTLGGGEKATKVLRHFPPNRKGLRRGVQGSRRVEAERRGRDPGRDQWTNGEVEAKKASS